MDIEDFYVEGYIIDDNKKKVSPLLKMKDITQVAALTDIAFRSNLNVMLRMNPKVREKEMQELEKILENN